MQVSDRKWRKVVGQNKSWGWFESRGLHYLKAPLDIPPDGGLRAGDVYIHHYGKDGTESRHQAWFREPQSDTKDEGWLRIRQDHEILMDDCRWKFSLSAKGRPTFKKV